MRVRGSVRTIAVPVAVPRTAGVSVAGTGVPAATAVRTSRPGKAALDQTGAAASPVASAPAWGDSGTGEPGDGSLPARLTPGAVRGLPVVREIFANGRHDLAPLANGTVMSWDDNTVGQLGNGTTRARHSAGLPVPVTGARTAARTVACARETPGQYRLRTLALKTSIS